MGSDGAFLVPSALIFAAFVIVVGCMVFGVTGFGATLFLVCVTLLLRRF